MYPWLEASPLHCANVQHQILTNPERSSRFFGFWKYWRFSFERPLSGLGSRRQQVSVEAPRDFELPITADLHPREAVSSQVSGAQSCLRGSEVAGPVQNTQTCPQRHGGRWGRDPRGYFRLGTWRREYAREWEPQHRGSSWAGSWVVLSRVRRCGHGQGAGACSGILSLGKVVSSGPSEGL